MGHGWEGVVLKLLRGKDYEFTVTGTEQVTEHYRRVSLTDGGMLGEIGVHPTMWVRLWFEHAGRPHQRAYTLVDPDVAAGTFAFEFSLHDGPACDWAREVVPGETIAATVQGTGLALPESTPSRLAVIGDTAALPAIDSLLTALPEVPATVWFEELHESDVKLAPRCDPARHEVRRLPRRDDGAHLLATVRAELPELVDGVDDAYVWVACDTVTTRALSRFVVKELGVPKQQVHALGYWRP